MSKLKTIIVASILALLSSNVLAHTALEATSPEAGSTINKAPAKISLTFKKNIHLTKVNTIRDGKHTSDLKLETQKNFGTSFLIPLNQTDAGYYLIEWRGLGSDGHFLFGSFSFTVK